MLTIQSMKPGGSWQTINPLVELNAGVNAGIVGLAEAKKLAEELADVWRNHAASMASSFDGWIFRVAGDVARGRHLMSDRRRRGEERSDRETGRGEERSDRETGRGEARR